jgi:hypothetical protein
LEAFVFLHFKKKKKNIICCLFFVFILFKALLEQVLNLVTRLLLVNIPCKGLSNCWDMDMSDIQTRILRLSECITYCHRWLASVVLYVPEKYRTCILRYQGFLANSKLYLGSYHCCY